MWLQAAQIGDPCSSAALLVFVAMLAPSQKEEDQAAVARVYEATRDVCVAAVRAGCFASWLMIITAGGSGGCGSGARPGGGRAKDAALRADSAGDAAHVFRHVRVRKRADIACLPEHRPGVGHAAEG